jgi:hypothetical protein
MMSGDKPPANDTSGQAIRNEDDTSNQAIRNKEGCNAIIIYGGDAMRSDSLGAIHRARRGESMGGNKLTDAYLEAQDRMARERAAAFSSRNFPTASFHWLMYASLPRRPRSSLATTQSVLWAKRFARAIRVTGNSY